MNPRVVKARAEKDGVLLLTFSNGEERQFSVLPYLDYPVYQPLKNQGVFEAVSVFNGTVCWGANGEIDFDPDTLYLESMSVGTLAAR